MPKIWTYCISILMVIAVAGCGPGERQAADNAGDNAQRTAENTGDRAERGAENAAGEARDEAGDAAQTGENAVLTAKVKAALLADQNIGATGINVDTRGNNVVLNGAVGTEDEKKLASQIARKQDGVQAVQNNLKVDQKMAQDRGALGSLSDLGMEARLKTALLGDDNLQATGINVESQNGNVSLVGTVPDAKHKQLAEQIVKKQDGVKKVTNKLAVGGNNSANQNNNRNQNKDQSHSGSGSGH